MQVGDRVSETSRSLDEHVCRSGGPAGARLRTQEPLSQGISRWGPGSAGAPGSWSRQAACSESGLVLCRKRRRMKIRLGSGLSQRPSLERLQLWFLDARKLTWLVWGTL